MGGTILFVTFILELIGFNKMIVYSGIKCKYDFKLLKFNYIIKLETFKEFLVFV